MAFYEEHKVGPDYLSRKIEEDPGEGLGIFLRDDYTPKTAPDYFERRRELITRLKGLPTNGSDVLAHWAQQWYNIAYGMHSRNEPNVRFFAFNPEERLDKILESKSEKLRKLDRSQFLTHIANPDTIEDSRFMRFKLKLKADKDLKETDKLLDYFSKSKSYVQKRRNVNRLTSLVEASYSLHLGAAWNNIFKMYRKDGSIRDVKNKEELLGDGAGTAWQKIVGNMASYGLPSFVWELRWFDEKNSPGYGKHGSSYFDSIDAKTKTLPKEAIHGLICTLPMRFFMDDVIPHFKIEDLKQWGKKIYGDKDITSKVLDFKEAKTLHQKGLVWRHIRSKGAEAIRFYFENTMPGKLTELLWETQTYDEHAERTMVKNPIFLQTIDKKMYS